MRMSITSDVTYATTAESPPLKGFDRITGDRSCDISGRSVSVAAVVSEPTELYQLRALIRLPGSAESMGVTLTDAR